MLKNLSRNPKWIFQDFLLLHFSLFLFSISAIFAKLASVFSLASTYFYFYYGLELLFIGAYAYLWQQILKKVDLSIAYANRGVVFIWTFVGSLLLFKETISINNVLGSVVISLGIYIVFRDHD